MEALLAKAEANVGWVIFIILAYSIGLALVEFGWEVWRKKITRKRLGEMWASVSVFIPAQITEKAATALFVGIYFYVYQFVPWTIPVNGFTVVLAIVVVDFLYYWEHRLEHEVRLLWSYHSIHHSSPIYNYTTALRVSFIDNFVTWVFFIPAVLLGFHPVLVLIALGFILTYQFWIHTELIGRMGWFEAVFNSPSHHRVHHGSDTLYLDKNYGGLFIIWDKLFGTFQRETFKPTYGLTKQINTINPVKVHFAEYIQIVKDVRQAKGSKEALGYLLKAPGWKPDTHEP